MNEDENINFVPDSQEPNSEDLGEFPSLPGSLILTPPPTQARAENLQRSAREETLLTALRVEMNSGFDRYVCITRIQK
jgi:hypothetical protein